MQAKLSVSKIREIKKYPLVKEYQDDKEMTILSVEYSHKNFRFASERLRDDKEVCLVAVKKSGSTLCYMGENAKSDREIVSIAVADMGSMIKYADKKFLSDKPIAMLAIRTCPSVLGSLSDELKDDEEVVLCAVKKNPAEIKFASRRIRDNAKIMREVYKLDRKTVIFGADELFEDEEFLKQVLNINGNSVGFGAMYNELPLGVFKQAQYFGYNVKLALQKLDLITLDRDKLYYLLKICDSGYYKKRELLHKYVETDDGQIVALILENGRISMQLMQEEFKYAVANHKIRTLPILLAKRRALEQNRAISPHRKKGERDKLIASLNRKAKSAVATFTENVCCYLDDREVVLTASKADGKVLFAISQKYGDDREIVLNCVENYTVYSAHPPIMSVVSDRMKNDKEIALKACIKDARNYEYIGEGLKNDGEIVEVCRKQKYFE